MITLKDKIQLDKKLKNKWKLYYLVLLILSNISIYFLATTKDEVNNCLVNKLIDHNQIRQNFTKVRLNLKSNLNDQSFATNESRQIYLLSSSGSIIVKNAYYLNKIALDPTESNNEIFFDIEISNDEYLKLVQQQSHQLILIKANQFKSVTKNKSMGDQYEMVF